MNVNLIDPPSFNKLELKARGEGLKLEGCRFLLESPVDWTDILLFLSVAKKCNASTIHIHV